MLYVPLYAVFVLQSGRCSRLSRTRTPWSRANRDIAGQPRRSRWVGGGVLTLASLALKVRGVYLILNDLVGVLRSMATRKFTSFDPFADIPERAHCNKPCQVAPFPRTNSTDGSDSLHIHYFKLLGLPVDFLGLLSNNSRLTLDASWLILDYARRMD